MELFEANALEDAFGVIRFTETKKTIKIKLYPNFWGYKEVRQNSKISVIYYV